MKEKNEEKTTTLYTPASLQQQIAREKKKEKWSWKQRQRMKRIDRKIPIEFFRWLYFYLRGESTRRRKSEVVKSIAVTLYRFGEYLEEKKKQGM